MLRSDPGNSEDVDVVITVNPDEVRAWAERHVHHIPAAVALILFRGADFYAGMEEEIDYRIVSPDLNGGKYETKRFHRYCSPWMEDRS